MSQTNDGLITLFNVIGYLICITIFATRARPCATCVFLCERGLLLWNTVAWLNAIHTSALTFSEIPALKRYFMTEMTKSPLSGVGGRWRMMECVRASGFLTHFTLHCNFAPELYKRALGVLLCIYNNRLLYICILHGKPRPQTPHSLKMILFCRMNFLPVSACTSS